MSVATPAPRNQFYRLVLSSGIWVKSTRWGTIYDSTNCCAAAGAVGLEVQSDGRLKVTPPQIRSAQSDFTGGIGLDDVQRAWKKLAGESGLTIPELMIPANVTWGDVITFLKEDRLVMIQADHGSLSLAERCQDSYNGDHAFILNRYRASDSRVQRYDSLCTGPAWVPQYGIRKAAEDLALRLRRDRGQLFVGVTKQRTVTLVVSLIAGAVADGRGSFVITKTGTALRDRPSTADSAIIRNVTAGQTFRAAQSFKNGPAVLGNREWKGTADGRCWLPEAYLKYNGHYTHRETYR